MLYVVIEISINLLQSKSSLPRLDSLSFSFLSFMRNGSSFILKFYFIITNWNKYIQLVDELHYGIRASPALLLKFSDEVFWWSFRFLLEVFKWGFWWNLRQFKFDFHLNHLDSYIHLNSYICCFSLQHNLLS